MVSVMSSRAAKPIRPPRLPKTVNMEKTKHWAMTASQISTGCVDASPVMMTVSVPSKAPPSISLVRWRCGPPGWSMMARHCAPKVATSPVA